jgi:hypothetical protein
VYGTVEPLNRHFTDVMSVLLVSFSHPRSAAAAVGRGEREIEGKCGFPGSEGVRRIRELGQHIRGGKSRIITLLTLMRAWSDVGNVHGESFRNSLWRRARRSWKRATPLRKLSESAARECRLWRPEGAVGRWALRGV